MVSVKFWIWGPRTVKYNMTCAHIFSPINHSTLMHIKSGTFERGCGFFCIIKVTVEIILCFFLSKALKILYIWYLYNYTCNTISIRYPKFLETQTMEKNVLGPLANYTMKLFFSNCVTILFIKQSNLFSHSPRSFFAPCPLPPPPPSSPPPPGRYP